MSSIAKILAYFVGVVVLGAFLAPPLYWGGQAVARGGVFTFLGETEFQKFFNRAVLVAALALLWPTVRSLRLTGLRDLHLLPDARWRAHLLLGFAIAAALVAMMAGGYLLADIYEFKKVLRLDPLPKLALSASVVAALEEMLFRGAIFGLLLRTLRPWSALFWTTVIFASVHFLKPDDTVQITSVNALSGFALLPHAFHQFAQPMLLLASFTTIFTLGWLLGYARLRTQSLWMSIGLHAGVVFVKMSFSKLTKREAEFLPWIGSELQIGLVPVAVLLVALLLVWRRLEYERFLTNSQPSY